MQLIARMARSPLWPALLLVVTVALVHVNQGLASRALDPTEQSASATWEQVSRPGQRIRGLTSRSDKPDQVYATVADDTVDMSSDGGLLWTPLSSAGLPNHQSQLLAVTVCPSGSLFAASWGSRGIYRFQENIWVASNAGVDDRYVAALECDARGVLYASTSSHGVYRSRDGANSWQQSINGLGTLRVYVIQARGDELWAGTEDGIYRSTDEGDNWQQVGLAGQIIYDLKFDDINPRRLWVAVHLSGVYVTDNGGQSWVPVGRWNTTLESYAVARDGSGQLYVGTANEGVYVYDHATDTWLPSGISGTTVSWLRTAGAKGSILLAATSDGIWALKVESSGMPTNTVIPFNHAASLSIAVTKDSRVHAVWKSDGMLWYSVRSPGGDWGRVSRIAAGQSPKLVASRSGELHLVFSQEFGINYEVFYTFNKDNEWSLPVNISHSAGASEQPSLAIDKDDMLTAAWMDDTPGYWSIYYATYNGTFWASKPVPNGHGQAPELATTDVGKIYLVWQDRVLLGGDNYDVFVSELGENAWSLPVNISNSPTVDSRTPSIVTTSDGFAHVVWLEADQAVMYSNTQGGDWMSAQEVAAGPFIRSVQIAAESSRTLHILWDEGDVVRDATWNGKSWPNHTVAFSSGFKPDVALASGAYGSVYAAWVTSVGPGQFSIQLSEFKGQSRWETTIDPLLYPRPAGAIAVTTPLVTPTVTFEIDKQAMPGAQTAMPNGTHVIPAWLIVSPILLALSLSVAYFRWQPSQVQQLVPQYIASPGLLYQALYRSRGWPWDNRRLKLLRKALAQVDPTTGRLVESFLHIRQRRSDNLEQSSRDWRAALEEQANAHPCEAGDKLLSLQAILSTLREASLQRIGRSDLSVQVDAVGAVIRYDDQVVCAQFLSADSASSLAILSTITTLVHEYVSGSRLEGAAEVLRKAQLAIQLLQRRHVRMPDPESIAIKLVAIRWSDQFEEEQKRRELEVSYSSYIVGRPVTEPDLFFGRDQEMRRILNAIQGDSLMIYGPRRIGKTSLLHQLRGKLEAQPVGGYWFIPVFINLQAVSESEFFATLIALTHQHFISSVGDPLTLRLTSRPLDQYTYLDCQLDLGTLTQAIGKQWSDYEIRLVWLLDEVDRLLSNNQLLQVKLRTLGQDPAISRHLRFVLAGVEPLKDLGDYGSPFYNIFTSVELGPLSPDDARELIVGPVKGQYRYSEEAIDAIIRASGAEPYWIQYICREALMIAVGQERQEVMYRDVRIVLWNMPSELQWNRGSDFPRIGHD